MRDIFHLCCNKNLWRKFRSYTSMIVATFKLVFKLSKYDSECTCPQVAKYKLPNLAKQVLDI